MAASRFSFRPEGSAVSVEVAVADGVAVAAAGEEEAAGVSADSVVVAVSGAAVAGRAGDEKDLEP